MVTAEIDRLSATDRRVLRYASVLGVTFDGGLLTSLLELEHAPIGRSAWPRLAQFIQDEGNGRYRFRHALMRDSAYEGLPYRTRTKLHARAGQLGPHQQRHEAA